MPDASFVYKWRCCIWYIKDECVCTIYSIIHHYSETLFRYIIGKAPYDHISPLFGMQHDRTIQRETMMNSKKIFSQCFRMILKLFVFQIDSSFKWVISFQFYINPTILTKRKSWRSIDLFYVSWNSNQRWKTGSSFSFEYQNCISILTYETYF